MEGRTWKKPRPNPPKESSVGTEKMHNAACIMHNAQGGVDRGIAKNAKAGGGRGVGGMREEGCYKNISNAAAQT